MADDALELLELLELLMATGLIGKARLEAGTETVKRHPKLARASATLSVVAQALLEARTWGDEDEVRVGQVWEAIEIRLTRSQVRAAVEAVNAMVPPPEALPEPDWRAELAKKTQAVAGLCRMLTSTIEFGANAQGTPVLAAMRAAPLSDPAAGCGRRSRASGGRSRRITAACRRCTRLTPTCGSSPRTCWRRSIFRAARVPPI